MNRTIRNVVIAMWNGKIMTLGILFVTSILLANVTVGNMSDLGLEFEDKKKCSEGPPTEPPETQNSEFIVIRGNDQIVYLRVPCILDDTSAEYIRNLYLKQNDNEKPGEESTECEAAELVVQSCEEPETVCVKKTYDLILPYTPEPLEIEEITIIKGGENPSKGTAQILPFIDDENTEEIKRFSSFEEFMNYLGYDPNYTSEPPIDSNKPLKTMEAVYSFTDDLAEADEGSPASNSGEGYSTTNVQVTGVDEGDIIKNDGKYAYIVSKDKGTVIIADVFPPEDAKILSKVRADGTISEIYVSCDQLVLLGSKNYQESFVYIFDIADKASPVFLHCHQFNGRIVQSRMIGGYVYLITNQYIYRSTKEGDLSAQPSQIYYFNNSDSSYSLTTIMSINVRDCSEEPVKRAILMGDGDNIFVSLNNIYITYTKYDYKYLNGYRYYSSTTEKTIVHRISIENGMIQYKAMGEVTGRALNRFSMGEHQGYFRIATTTGNVRRNGEGGAKNQVYVLDMDLKIVGSVLDIAPGERIYSARFMGNRAYMVTFKKVDPFFVIDLTDPKNPKILGELKIPGYSDYLHPYDEDHIIGIGKDTVDMGTFAWYQGVKLSLFDVSDVQNPKEISKFIIGDRGTDSLALRDPHAFLLSREKNLLVIPIRLAEIDQSKYPNGAPPNTCGDYKWNGVYVFHLSVENGFVLKGRITHSDNNEVQTGYSYWNCYNDKSIKRSFYISDVLYTFSESMLKMNNLDNLNEINRLVLSEDTEIEEDFTDGSELINLPRVWVVP